MELHKINYINKIAVNLIEHDLILHMNMIKIRNVYFELFSRLDNLAIVNNPDSPNENNISDIKWFAGLNSFKIDHLYNDLFKK